MALGLMLTSLGLTTRGLGASSLMETTTFTRVLTLMMGVTTHLENASCAIGRSTKEPPMKMRANAPHLKPRTPHV
jgi:hypothetical protein